MNTGAIRVMRDSTQSRGHPAAPDCDIIAPYRNGMFASTLAQVRARFPTQKVAWIDVNGGAPDDADILDVETGDATPAEAALWAKARHLLHPHAYPPIIYCNRATLTPVFNAMNAAGLAIGPGFRLWVATLDGTKRVPDMTGVTAVQYAGRGTNRRPLRRVGRLRRGVARTRQACTRARTRRAGTRRGRPHRRRAHVPPRRLARPRHRRGRHRARTHARRQTVRPLRASAARLHRHRELEHADASRDDVRDVHLTVTVASGAATAPLTARPPCCSTQRGPGGSLR